MALKLNQGSEAKEKTEYEMPNIRPEKLLAQSLVCN
jgi:hypothetical protein